MIILRKTLCLLLLLVGWSNCKAQSTWEKTFGGSHTDFAKSIIQTSDGGYAVAGRTDSKVAGRKDAWVIKLDSDANVVWDKAFGSISFLAWKMMTKEEKEKLNYNKACSIVETSDGGYAVAGYTRNKGAGTYDVLVIKLDGAGNKVWDKTFGGSNWDVAYNIEATSDGGYVVVGRTHSKGAGDSDIWVLKLDGAGNKIWDKTFGGSGFDAAESIIQTSDGGYAMACLTKSKGVGKEEVWVIKLDGTGNKIWDKTFGGSDMDIARSIVATSDGGYAITDFTSSKGAGSYDAWVIKLDGTGNKVWEKTFGGGALDEARSIVAASDGGYAIAGFTSSKGAGKEDAWVIKLDGTGHKVWDKTFGGG